MEIGQSISIRNKIIGILVKRARVAAAKNQQECADLLGCSPVIYRQYEQGRRGLSLPQLVALAYFFDVPAMSLWDDGHVPSEEVQPGSLPLEQMMHLRRRMLAVQFRQCRQAAGLSQREIGQLLGCSGYKVSQYEQGIRDIPLSELEVAVDQCGHSVADFVDEETIPLAQSEQQRRTLTRLDELPPDVRDFVLNPTNALYLRIAMLLSTMKANDLRQIAETLLDITY
jgi:transcriptional regulator with XRE-family HTH domain